MKTFLYQLTAADGSTSRVRLFVEHENNHYVCSSAAIDERGVERSEQGSLAPRFYGETIEQSLRRMVTALENSYEDVERIEGS